MEKKSRIILAQVDHLSGEVLGFAVEKIMACGARNVQLIPTITKKNRPGSILIIDTDKAGEEAVSRFLSQELKITGYHRVETNHVFQPVTFASKNLRVSRNGASSTFRCDIKVIGDPSSPLAMDIEHDGLVAVRESIEKDLDLRLSLNDLRAMIESRLRDGGDIVLEL
ncbi:MAG TPA: nickel insertion protein [Nitrospirota bacterium]|nr:nickel insertion protein [Nitrospirota bacterium]